MTQPLPEAIVLPKGSVVGLPSGPIPPDFSASTKPSTWAKSGSVLVGYHGTLPPGTTPYGTPPDGYGDETLSGGEEITVGLSSPGGTQPTSWIVRS